MKNNQLKSKKNEQCCAMCIKLIKSHHGQKRAHPLTWKEQTEQEVHMLLSDIIGPVMVGPSSSHTAGAVRIGNVARRLLAERVASARITLHGSFRATGRGHGTDRAIVAGLLGMHVDDSRIPDSFEIAEKEGLDFSLTGADLGDSFHPNTAKIDLTGVSGTELEVVASSVGGGRIRVVQIDGLDVSFSGECPTLIVQNVDQPGHVAEVTSMLEHKSVNIAAMQLVRENRGGKAAMVIECDQEIPAEAVKWLTRLEGVIKVIYLSMEEPESGV
jgi:L-serine dehydratase